MSTQTLLEKLKLAVEIEEKGLRWEWYDPHQRNWIPGGCGLYSALMNAREIRLKPWRLPPPPEGRQWHRPDWTQDMLPDGWRPFLLGETGEGEIQDGERSWLHLNHVGCYVAASKDQAHQRTRRPLPAPPEWVPLECSDVPPGSCLRGTGNDWRNGDWRDCWTAALEVCPNGVRINRQNEPVSWKNLADWQILRPGETWQPCRKLKEVKA